MERISVVPSPALLAEYARVDSRIPLEIVKAGQGELGREFKYALISLIFGGVMSLSVIAGFIYLVIAGHPAAAGSLLGAGVLNLVTGFVRNRIRK
jgi:hypothetical protein